METNPPAVASKILSLDDAQRAAIEMVRTFASVGATHFDVTFKHIDESKRGFRPRQSVETLCTSLPPLMATAPARRNNIIIRPTGDGVTFIQLDDLDAVKTDRISGAAFLTIETSPGNFQAWIAMQDYPRGTASRLRRGIGADKNASGATRVAGTFNFKEKYAPRFPIVRIATLQAGHVVTVAELEALHVLAPEEAPAQIMTNSRDRRPARTWPNYEKCLEGAPIGPSGNPRRTAADFVFCKIACSWGHSVEATARQLMEVSTKAQENGTAYALKTAQSAAYSAAQRMQKRPNPGIS